jgi:Fe-S-cluster containining protein
VTSSRRKLRRAARKVRKPQPAQRDARGRLHLRLVVDDASGQEYFELTKPVFEDDWQNRMALATANTSFALLREQKNATSAAELGKKAMAATSTLVNNLLSQAPAGSVACRAGCAHCCHQRVGVTVPEALAILGHLIETRTPEALADVRRHVEHAHERTRGLSREQRNSPEYPCPFLEGSECSIYGVRPLACRGVHSTDEHACRTKLHDEEHRAAYDHGELPGHSFAEPIRAVHAISAGMQLGLSEGLGLHMQPLDLTAAMHVLLREAIQSEAAPNFRASCIESWLDGSPAFAEARGGDASDDRAYVALSGALGVAKP